MLIIIIIQINFLQPRGCAEGLTITSHVHSADSGSQISVLGEQLGYSFLHGTRIRTTKIYNKSVHVLNNVIYYIKCKTIMKQKDNEVLLQYQFKNIIQMHTLLYTNHSSFRSIRPTWLVVHLLRTTAIDWPKGRKLREYKN